MRRWTTSNWVIVIIALISSIDSLPMYNGEAKEKGSMLTQRHSKRQWQTTCSFFRFRKCKEVRIVRQLMHKNGLFVHLYIELFWCFFLKDVSLRNHFQEGAQKFKPGNSQIRTLLRRTYTSKYAKNEIF